MALNLDPLVGAGWIDRRTIKTMLGQPVSDAELWKLLVAAHAGFRCELRVERIPGSFDATLGHHDYVEHWRFLGDAESADLRARRDAESAGWREFSRKSSRTT